MTIRRLAVQKGQAFGVIGFTPDRYNFDFFQGIVYDFGILQEPVELAICCAFGLAPAIVGLDLLERLLGKLRQAWIGALFADLLQHGIAGQVGVSDIGTAGRMAGLGSNLVHLPAGEVA